MWYRHLIRYFGHDTKKISWVVGGTDGPATVRLPEPALPYVTAAPPGASLSDLLLERQIDAFFAPLPPKKLHPLDGPIVRLFPEYPVIEKKYFADTGCYPPQHALLLKRAAWDRDRSVGGALVATLDECEARFEANQSLFPYNSPGSSTARKTPRGCWGPRTTLTGWRRTEPLWRCSARRPTTTTSQSGAPRWRSTSAIS